jgi:hypothetical protein
MTHNVFAKMHSYFSGHTNNITMATTSTPSDVEFKVGDANDKEWDETTQKGAVDGLFRSCMTAIRSSHKSALEVRTGLIVAGLFTDKRIYREAIALFYTVTRELEIKMKSVEFRENVKDDAIELEVLEKMQRYGEKFYFTDAYEKDLRVLFTPETWQMEVEEIVAARPAAVAFRDHIRSMNAPTDLSAALFSLWGALVIGGGAAARRRAKALCGDDVLNLFEKVSGPGREKRKAEFIAFFDSLAAPASPTFDKITVATELCMEKSNAMLRSISANPWWLKWVGLVAVATPAIALALWLGPSSKGEDSNWTSGLFAFLSRKPPHTLAM